jgi:uncharacterized protein (DUF1330 family)
MSLRAILPWRPARILGLPVEEISMNKKAYFISCYRSISDPEAVAAYAKLAGPALKAAGGRYLALGEAAEAYESGRKTRTIIVEFPSLEAARAAHDGAAYQEALKVFNNAAERDVRIVEGLE